MIRWALPDDATELADVHVTTWQLGYEGMFPKEFLQGLDREERARWWRRFISRGARVHVAVDDRVVGYCHPGPADDEGWGEIFALYVHPDRWGEGFGYELLKTGESTLIAMDIERALLWVLDGNERGRRFYERQGWSPGKPIRVEEIGGVQVTELRYEKTLTARP